MGNPSSDAHQECCKPFFGTSVPLSSDGYGAVVFFKFFRNEGLRAVQELFLSHFLLEGFDDFIEVGVMSRV